MSDANTKILQSPQVRSVDNVKASLKIGEREPTATGSFQPGIGGVGINPLVNTQFTYIDVGVNVDLTPRVHDNDEISMHVELDISSVAGTVNLGGIDQPIIGQSKISHDLRVREGEVSLLGGLMQQQESKSVTGIPGLSSIPLIRRLFSGESIDRNKSELMIALIPHIVRRPDIYAGEPARHRRGQRHYHQTELRAAAGTGRTGQSRRLRLLRCRVTPPAAAVIHAPAAPNPAPALPPLAATRRLRLLRPPATAPPFPPVPPGAAPAAPAAGSEYAAGRGQARVFFQPAQMDAAVGAGITVAVAVDGAADVASAPMQIQFDPRIVAPEQCLRRRFPVQGRVSPRLHQNIHERYRRRHHPARPPAQYRGRLRHWRAGEPELPGRGARHRQRDHPQPHAVAIRRAQVVARGTPQLTINVK